MRHRSTAAEHDAVHAQELFRSRLDGQIDLRHPLAKLAQRMPWTELEDALSMTLPPAPVAGGRPALPVRLMAGLLYLKHAHDLSDEDTCARWLENPYWQFFTGEVFFQTALPCDPSSLVRWRQRLGEAGMEELLAQTIAAARSLQAITPRDLERVIVDTTVQEKAVAYPTDSRLLEVARAKVVCLAQRAGCGGVQGGGARVEGQCGLHGGVLHSGGITGWPRRRNVSPVPRPGRPRRPR